jgi:hypothetical protein
MFTLAAHRAGGIAAGIKNRKAALLRYAANPSICRMCGRVIAVPPGAIIDESRRKKFCNHSCAASYTNRRRESRAQKCPDCGRRMSPGCARCRACSVIAKRAVALGSTKGELRHRRSNYQSWRATLQTHAIKTHRQHGGEQRCIVCGYSNHVQVCHRVPVSSFPDSAAISEINAIGNLVPLCPNHHWEFDHGLITL